MSRTFAAVAAAVALSLMLPTAPVSAAPTSVGTQADDTVVDPTADPTAGSTAGSTAGPTAGPTAGQAGGTGTGSAPSEAPSQAQGTGGPGGPAAEPTPATTKPTSTPSKKATKKTPKRATKKARKASARTLAAARTAAPDWTRVRKFSPDHYVPPAGPKFNNPYGNMTSRRRILTHVIRTINSVPGYRIPRNPATGRPFACPRAPRLFPGKIKIALYSIADHAFTDALIRAHRRCVSVKILMNSHLNVTTSPSWARLLHTLGNRGFTPATKRSFAYRCTHGCLGSGVLHTKMYMFSNPFRSSNVVMTGSSNMTSNAVRVQWNDLFTVRSNATLYGQYVGMFNRMVRDRPARGPFTFHAGRYVSTFYPFRNATSRTDRTMASLRSIRCGGARGGAGINGRTVLYVVMHSWHGTRGKYIAQRIRQMYNRGCYVRILYSFMGHGTFNLLTRGTGSRMVARRVLFPGPRGVVAAKYSHMKMFAASGNVAGDSSSWVTWTGSNNFGDRSLRADEVTLRIPSRAIYRRYIEHWAFVRNRRSSSVWAIFEEPGGGGRAPD